MIDSILNTGRNALLAHRAALQITGHNIANAQTPGYVRQRPLLAVVPGAAQGGLGAAGLGSGVQMVGVQRLHDLLLQAQVEVQTGRSGYYSSRHLALAQVEALFTDLQSGGLSQALSGFFSALTQVMTHPTDATARAEVLQRAALLTDRLNQTASGLDAMRRNFDTGVAEQVREINRLAEEVAALNRQMLNSGDPAFLGDLRSRQDVLVQELALRFGVTALRYDNGSVDLLVGGQRLVQAGQAHALRAAPDPADPSVTRVVFAYSGEPAPLGGELAGLIEVRDLYLPAYQARLDDLARTLADRFNALHAQGFDLEGRQGGDFFTYGLSPARTLQLATSGLKHRLPEGAASDFFASATEPLPLDSPPAGTVRLSGVPVALDLATDSLEDLATKINAAGIPDLTAQVLPSDFQGQTHYRLVLTAPAPPQLTDEGGVFAALGLLFGEVEGRPAALAASQSGAPGDGSHALSLAGLRDEKLLSGGRATLEEYFADLLGRIGVDAAGAAQLEAAATTVTQSLAAHLQARSGVSLDEEGVDLVRYQQAYLAAQRVIMTALEMLDAVLEIGRR